MRNRLLTWLAVVALLAAACGADDASTVTEPASAEAGVAASEVAASAAGDMPDLDMVSVYTGETVNLQTLVDGETPTLLWFWAPH